MTVLQQQWDRMANVDWGQYFDGSVPTSSVELWTALFKYEIGGERRFAAIAAFALRVLTTPLSNATVERAFSVMNLTKTKIRNRMQTKMLEALLRLRLWSHGRHCCAAFEPSAAMYALFNREMYDDDQVGGADGTEAGAADEMIDEIIVMISGDEEILYCKFWRLLRISGDFFAIFLLDSMILQDFVIVCVVIAIVTYLED
ncbi:Zinc finger protein 862 [Frankliniella fusca]|uniref:Zinc finger protein 862 n=1 Tax=Frankliniella fusca TaxID=407009 RepID=A0AAE1LUI8_9NEOP|nr:Zinc finger protein 862 [Frankliniella fusca]